MVAKTRSLAPLVTWIVLIVLVLVTVPAAYYVLRRAGVLSPSFLFSALARKPTQDTVPAEQILAAQRAAQPVQTIQVYFLVRDSGALGREERKIPANVDLNARVRAALELLWIGPDSPGLAPVIPDGLVCRSVFFDPTLGRIYLDFSPELRQLHLSTVAEWAMVYGIVNTVLGAVPEAKTVQFLCEGEPLREWQGNWDLYGPLRADHTRVDFTRREVTRP